MSGLKKDNTNSLARTTYTKLSDIMLEVLMDCHERELMKLAPLEVASTSNSKGLIIRGMLEVREYFTKENKKIYGLFVTRSGKNYLKRHLTAD